MVNETKREKVSVSVGSGTAAHAQMFVLQQRVYTTDVGQIRFSMTAAGKRRGQKLISALAGSHFSRLLPEVKTFFRIWKENSAPLVTPA